MGFFGTYAFEHGRWITLPEAERPPLVEPFLWMNILNSDFTEVVYAPAGPGTGVAYLGQTPRAYFGYPEASAPTDPDREAEGLAAWSGRAAAEIRGYLAEDDPEDTWLGKSGNDDPAEWLVEIKTARLLTALGLPLPTELR
ncbi:hypothetical protein ACFOWZ_09405 [Lentzea rhizosphaerae]|uniref:Uncharacterized protein n=1 Tax=Lentzea rhizosphaerae TaxID=2041025 RepID=A0ABV8BN08_9PSEU